MYLLLFCFPFSSVFFNTLSSPLSIHTIHTNIYIYIYLYICIQDFIYLCDVLSCWDNEQVHGELMYNIHTHIHTYIDT